MIYILHDPERLDSCVAAAVLSTGLPDPNTLVTEFDSSTLTSLRGLWVIGVPFTPQQAMEVYRRYGAYVYIISDNSDTITAYNNICISDSPRLLGKEVTCLFSPGCSLTALVYLLARPAMTHAVKGIVNIDPLLLNLHSSIPEGVQRVTDENGTTRFIDSAGRIAFGNLLEAFDLPPL